MLRYRVRYLYPITGEQFRFGDGDFKVRQPIETPDHEAELARIIESCTGRSGVVVDTYKPLSVCIGMDEV